MRVTDVSHDGPPMLILPNIALLFPQSCLMSDLLLLSNFSIFIPFIEILLWSLIGNRDPAFWPENVSPYYSLNTGETYVSFSLLFQISCRMFWLGFAIQCMVKSCVALYRDFHSSVLIDVIWGDLLLSWHLSFYLWRLCLPIFFFEYLFIGRRSCYNDLGYCMLKSLQPYEGVILILNVAVDWS